jgi:hypothetical protein
MSYWQVLGVTVDMGGIKKRGPQAPKLLQGRDGIEPCRRDAGFRHLG